MGWFDKNSFSTFGVYREQDPYILSMYEIYMYSTFNKLRCCKYINKIGLKLNVISA